MQQVPSIGQFKLRVLIEVWEYSQDDSGGNIRTLIDSWEQWANIANKTTSQASVESQQQWTNSEVFTMRFLREIKNTYTILWSGARYIINNSSVQEETKKKFYILRCSKTDQDV